VRAAQNLHDASGDFLGLLEPSCDVPYLLVSDGGRLRWAFPAANPSLLRASMAVYTPGTARGITAWYAARVASRAGLSRVIPARRGTLHAPLSRSFATVMGLDEIHLSVASSFDGRRCVVGILDAQGRSRGFAKIAMSSDPDAVARLRREAEVLQRLSGMIESVDIPRVIHVGRLGEFEVMVVTPITGHPGLRPSRLTRKQIEAAVDLFSFRGLPTTIGQHLDIEASQPEWTHRVEAVRAATAAVADRPITSGLVHGDFAAWNLLERRGRLGIVDWEQAQFDGLPFWDLWYYSVQAAVISRSTGALQRVRAAIRGKGPLGDILSRYAARLHIPSDLAPHVLLVFLARTGGPLIDRARAGAPDARRGVPLWMRFLDETLEVLR